MRCTGKGKGEGMVKDCQQLFKPQAEVLTRIADTKKRPIPTKVKSGWIGSAQKRSRRQSKLDLLWIFSAEALLDVNSVRMSWSASSLQSKTTAFVYRLALQSSLLVLIVRVVKDTPRSPAYNENLVNRT